MASLLRPLIGRQQGQIQAAELGRQREIEEAERQREAEDRQSALQRRALEMALLERNVNAPPPTRNIDPLSPEGVQATVARERQLAQFRPKPAGSAGAPTRPTDFSRRAAFLEPRATEAAQTLLRYYERGPSPRQGAQKIPVVGNFILSDEQRQMKQAAEVVAAAVLRLESGATITEQELESLVDQMVPAPGDDPGTLQQKKRTLELAMQQLGVAAEPSQQGGQGERAPNPNEPSHLVEQRALYDRAAASLQAQGKDPTSVLGPRP